MEDIHNYINENNIMNVELYNIFRDSLSCQICTNIFIEPMMCMNCQNSYCKNCIRKWSAFDGKCPNRCENPNYQNSRDKNDLLSKIKFKCKFCNNIFEYNEMINHYNLGCHNNKRKIYYKEPTIKESFRKIENKDMQILDSKNRINSK
jgi:hypothetical protein